MQIQEDLLPVVAEFSPFKVVLHPPYLSGLGMFVYDQAKDYGLESLSAIVRKAEDLGLMLCIENMFAKTHMLVEPDEFEEIFKRFPSLKLTLDSSRYPFFEDIGNNGGEFKGVFSGVFRRATGIVSKGDQDPIKRSEKSVRKQSDFA